jgi:hypothetical protein
VVQHKCIDQLGRSTGVLVRGFPHTKNATTGVRHSPLTRDARAQSFPIWIMSIVRQRRIVLVRDLSGEQKASASLSVPHANQ